MPAIIPKYVQRKSQRGLVVLGVDLHDAREEIFVRMVCDGISLGLAYVRAGFTSKTKGAASQLFNLPRVQARAAAILEARRSTGVVSLPEVTDMLKRVFAGAYTEGEFSAAHNAAFSLARLYGHVTDKASIEVIRRPSRDPDAPSEQALAAWVESLPALPGAGFASSPGPQASGLAASPRPEAFFNAPASPLGEGLEAHDQSPNEINDLAGPEPSPPPQGPSLESDLFNEINWLDGSGTEAPGRPENGAPSRPVTMALQPGGHSVLLASGAHRQPPPGGKQKRVPRRKPRVPLKIREKRAELKKRRVKPVKQLPSAKDLFG